MRYITLTMVTDERATTDHVYDEDTETFVPAPDVPEVTKPVVVNPEFIRCFYARKNNKPGTRITFGDGRGFAVTETVDEIVAAINPN